MVANVNADDGGVWVTCADLARSRKVSAAAITKRLNQIERAGTIVTKRDGRSRLVDLAAFDRAIGEVGDAVKEQAAATASEQRNASPIMRDAQAQKAQYDARIRALDLAERQRQLLPIKGDHGVEAAATEIGAVLARDLDTMARYADAMASAVGKDGVAGARRLFKEISVTMRRQVAVSLSQLATQGTDAESGGPIETLLPDE
ncbi:helix-turn-helix domain-containing protein [Mesorhizobium sp. CAU 1732]|uniref:helix-turn-helix domain-containing protein n=1 Tax=Mesorhizobium sp. CAU 1732 TaxID=3140358 RepID=UPI0032604A90